LLRLTSIAMAALVLQVLNLTLKGA